MILSPSDVLLIDKHDNKDVDRNMLHSYSISDVLLTNLKESIRGNIPKQVLYGHALQLTPYVVEREKTCRYCSITGL